MDVETKPLVSVPVPLGRRAHWETLVFAASGVGLSSLIFTGLVAAFKEETLSHFAFVLFILVVASLVFFERIGQVVLNKPDSECTEKSTKRIRLLISSVGIAVIVVILHRSLDSALRNEVDAIAELLVGIIIASRITAAWLRGVRYVPSCAAERGARSGAFVGGLFGILILIFLCMGINIPGLDAAPPTGLNLPELTYRVVLGLVLTVFVSLLWSGFGYMGGMAVDKRWGSSATRGILFALCLYSFPLSFGLFAYSYYASNAWNNEAFRLIFMAVGWGLGLMLHADVCDRILDVQTSRVRPPKANPVWEGFLVGGLVITVILLWHQEANVKFFESDGTPPPPARRKYQTQFTSGATRFINFEFNAPKRMLPANEYRLDETWIAPEGQPLRRTVAAKAEDLPIDHAGWDTPGGWKPGVYVVQLRVSSSEVAATSALNPPIAEGRFEIVGGSDIAAEPPPVNPQHVKKKSNPPDGPSGTLISMVTPPQPPNVTPVNPSRPPQPRQQLVPMEILMQNARTALAQGNLITPEKNNALYWVRQARRISPQDLAAIQIEQLILTQGMAVVQQQQKAGQYDSALRLLASLESLYPNDRNLPHLRSQIWAEQRQRAQRRR